MNRTRVLLHALATLAPLLLFSIALLVFATQLFAGSFSIVALVLVLVALVWIASGVWRRPKRGASRV